MDWDRTGSVLWLPADAGYPTDDDFATNIRAIKYDHAIEALRDVYARHADPAPPVDKAWVRWNDGTIFTPGQVEAVRGVYDEVVAERGGPVPQKLFD